VALFLVYRGDGVRGVVVGWGDGSCVVVGSSYACSL
jgi:hypothetical protein